MHECRDVETSDREKALRRSRGIVAALRMVLTCTRLSVSFSCQSPSFHGCARQYGLSWSCKREWHERALCRNSIQSSSDIFFEDADGMPLLQRVGAEGLPNPGIL